MNENNQMQNHNDEIEIDLRELWQELKKNIVFIAGVTTAFVVAAAVYSFVVAKPVYEYNAMIRIPNGVSGAQINNFVEIFKDDIKPDEELNSSAKCFDANFFVVAVNCNFEFGVQSCMPTLP